MRFYEDEAGAKKICIRWDFCLYELPVNVIKDLSKDIHNSNEFFNALGNMKGVENENMVEGFQGKVMVLCTARYGGNILMSHVYVDAVNYIFNRAYDMAKKKVVKMMTISNNHLVVLYCETQKLVNKVEWMPILENIEVEEQNSTTIEDNQSSTSKIDFGTRLIKRCLMRTTIVNSSNSQHVKKMKGKEKIEDEEV